MKFAKDALRDLLCFESDELEKVSTTFIGKRRWVDDYELVFRHIASGKLYSTLYSLGATESQDYRPFEDDPDEIECAEVEPFEKVVIEYRKAESA